MQIFYISYKRRLISRLICKASRLKQSFKYSFFLVIYIKQENLFLRFDSWYTEKVEFGSGRYNAQNKTTKALSFKLLGL